MDSARRELDRLSYEAWGQLARDLKTGSKSMGRVGLSYARRHPALLLGGGALLGLAAVAYFKRSKPAPTSAAPAVAAPAVRVPSKPAWQGLLTKIISMWIMDTLASEFRVEQEKRAEGDTDGEHERDLDRERAESLFSS
jgi:hypothetical protein